MIKVLIVHPHADSQADGIRSHCNTLYHIFKENKDIRVIKPENYPYFKNRLFNGVFKFRVLCRSIKDSGADIVHVHGYTTLQVAQAMLAAAMCRKIVIYSPHWHPFFELRRPLFAKVFFNVLIVPLIRRCVTYIICINKEDSSYMQRFNKPVFTFPHCLKEEMSPAEMSPSMNNNSKKRILFVGRFDASNKGIEYLWHLPEGKYDIHLVGKGSIEPRSDMIIHQNIPEPELLEQYLRSDIVVIPSQYEAFSLVALEALSVGTPVVMSDKVRIADYLENVDGVKVFRYGDYDGFREAVESGLDLKVDMDKIHRIFSRDVIQQEYADMYEHAVNS